MPHQTIAVMVLIASPGDAAEERAVVRDILNDWNVLRGRRAGVVILPWLWERHAVPQLGGRPQAIINAQAVDRADVVIACFDGRLGTATGVDVSGTAEEINRAADLGKPVHVYFSAEPLPRDVDPQQLIALRVFKSDLEARGLLGSYTDPQDLAGQVLRAIESDVETFNWGLPSPSELPNTGADLRWEHRSSLTTAGGSRPRPKGHLIVRNIGAAAAEDLRFSVEPIGNTSFVFPNSPVAPQTLRPKSELSWALFATPHIGASGNTIAVHATWREGETLMTESQTITLK